MGSSQIVRQASRAAWRCKGFVLITNYLESIFCQQCCAAKTTNARSNHHHIGLLGGVLCLVWLLQDGASSCLSLACCQGSDSFWVKCPDTPSIAVVAKWSEDILAAKAVRKTCPLHYQKGRTGAACADYMHAAKVASQARCHIGDQQRRHIMLTTTDTWFAGPSYTH